MRSNACRQALSELHYLVVCLNQPRHTRKGPYQVWKTNVSFACHMKIVLRQPIISNYRFEDRLRGEAFATSHGICEYGLDS